MSAKAKVKAVIKDPALKSISFSLDGIRVLGREFTKLEKEIDGNTLQVGVDPSIPTPASYEPVRNIIRLKSDSVGTDLGSRAAIAHECTHAYLSSKNVSGITNEVAAFLVEVLFGLKKAPERVRRAIQPNPFVPPAETGEQGIGQQALALVDKLQMDRRSCQLTRKDYAALAKAIGSHHHYQHLKLR
jgi:hypothetical protein